MKIFVKPPNRIKDDVTIVQVIDSTDDKLKINNYLLHKGNFPVKEIETDSAGLTLMTKLAIFSKIL